MTLNYIRWAFDIIQKIVYICNFLIILQHLLYLIDLGLTALTSSLIPAAMMKEKSPCALKVIKCSLSFINTKKCHCVQWRSLQNIIFFERYVIFSCNPKFSHPILVYFSRYTYSAVSKNLRAPGFVLLHKVCFSTHIYYGTIRSPTNFSSFHF